MSLQILSPPAMSHVEDQDVLRIWPRKREWTDLAALVRTYKEEDIWEMWQKNGHKDRFVYRGSLPRGIGEEVKILDCFLVILVSGQVQSLNPR